MARDRIGGDITERDRLFEGKNGVLRKWIPGQEQNVSLSRLA